VPAAEYWTLTVIVTRVLLGFPPPPTHLFPLPFYLLISPHLFKASTSSSTFNSSIFAMLAQALLLASALATPSLAASAADWQHRSIYQVRCAV
jgi:hypothetical protein